MSYADQIADYWFRHRVTVVRPGRRDALEQATPAERFKLRAAVNGQAQTVTDRNGQEITASATLRWHVNGPMPEPGWKITLPAAFGLKPEREVIMARMVDSGTDMTPNFVEVSVK